MKTFKSKSFNVKGQCLRKLGLNQRVKIQELSRNWDLGATKGLRFRKLGFEKSKLGELESQFMVWRQQSHHKRRVV